MDGYSGRMSVITLTTDFGLDDWFVGALKGAILACCPTAQTVDLTHGVPPGNIRAGAFALWAGSDRFPRGTVHLAVVDPGVGGSRPAIAVRTERFTFVGPDNGLLAWALARERVRAIHRLENTRLFRHPVSATFHGRDVFAPITAFLACGGTLRRVGPRVADYTRLPWPAPVRRPDGVAGEILYLDRFGNAITNLDAPSLSCLDLLAAEVKLPGGRRCPVREYYGAVPPGQAVALLGSCGLLEIAIGGGHAARQLRLQPGEPVALVAPRSRRRNRHRVGLAAKMKIA
jgi:S-adenosylmethionine hydrolase